MKPFVFLAALAPLWLTFPAVGNIFITSSKAQPRLEKIYEGNHLVLYTTGKRISLGGNSKSGVWTIPVNMAAEMWVKRPSDEQPVRLDPRTFRRQLRRLLAEYPEVHRGIKHHSFSYQNLNQSIPELDGHVEKVLLVRMERKNMRSLDSILRPK